MEQQLALAKISRPRVTGVYCRERLFNRLDEGLGKPLFWVKGPAGSGKTTLLASWLEARKYASTWYQLDQGDSDIASFFYYLGLAVKKAAPSHKSPLPLLTPEYQFGIPTFARRFIEMLCSRLKPPAVLVFDNYHHLPVDSPFHAVMRETIAAIPEGVTVVIASRTALAEPLALFQVHNQAGGLGWDELRFESGETKGLLAASAASPLDSTGLEQIQRLTDGWAAGLVLLQQRLRSGSVTSAEIAHLVPHEFFGYFASEIFGTTDSQTQDFLLKTAFLPRIYPRAAAALTDDPHASRRLATLAQDHFFTEQFSRSSPVYQYHPIFREFLLARAADAYTPESVRQIQQHAASLLEETGDLEAAAELYHGAGEWPGLVAMILRHAMSLFLQSRSATLEAWIDALPTEISATTPWLQYWKAVCRLPFTPVTARGHAETAYAAFRGDNDGAGAYLAWSAIIDSYILEWNTFEPLDHWIEEMEALRLSCPEFPGPEIEATVTNSMFGALAVRQPFHPSFPEWEQRTIALVRSEAEPGFRMQAGTRLLLHYTLVGDRAGAEFMHRQITALARKEPEASPAIILFKAVETYFAWTFRTVDDLHDVMSAGMEAAQASGIHLWDTVLLSFGVYGPLAAGDVATGHLMLDQMAALLDPDRSQDVGHYHNNRTWALLLRGDVDAAVIESRKGLAADKKAGLAISVGQAHASYAQTMIASGELEEATRHLDEAERFGERTKSAMIAFKCRFWRAQLHLEKGDTAEALACLRQALAVGRTKRIFALEMWLPQVVTRLLALALEHDIEPEFVRELIQTRGLVPEDASAAGERWPWPIRVQTLGGFRIWVNGEPLVFSGKVQKKPLDLLMALVTLGGRDVPEAKLTEYLWPEAEGDAGYRSLKITIQRLRELLKEKAAIGFQDGRVNIDPRYCWVDAWVFESAVRPVLRSPAHAGTAHVALVAHLERALGFYRGHYLGADHSMPWAVSYREKLRELFARTIGTLGAALLDSGEAGRAERCYVQGLAIDDLYEPFYQGLMRCHLQNGHFAGVAATYTRCRDVLRAALGVGPSRETEAIYEAVRNNARCG